MQSHHIPAKGILVAPKIVVFNVSDLVCSEKVSFWAVMSLGEADYGFNFIAQNGE